MNFDPNNHITDLMETFLAGGLSDEERTAFQAHLRDCAACAGAMRAAEELDGSINSLFSNARPDLGLEDRLVGAMRAATQARSARPMHPMVRRAAIGIAATILLGGAGYVASSAVENGTLPFLPSHDAYTLGEGQALGKIDRDDRTGHSTLYEQLRRAVLGPEKSSSNLRQNGLAMDMYRADFRSYGSLNGTARESEIKERRGSVFDVPEMVAGTVAKGGIDYVEKTRRINTLEPGRLVKEENIVKQDIKAATDGSGKEVGANFFVVPPVAQSSNFTQLPTTGVPGSIGNVPVQSGKAVSVPDGGTMLLGGQVLQQQSTYFRAGDLRKAADLPMAEWGNIGKRLPALNAAPPHSEVLALADAESGKKEVEQKSEGQPAPQGKPAQDQAPPPVHTPANPVAERKVIRSGDMTFEVDSFDSTVTTLTKIVNEEGGFVATTDSDKLANGKVKGTIVLRVPPDRLDTLVLKLRGVGDLKSQKINAQDITKQYTDLQSELRAARAMEDRLLEIIKTGKGEVKDLLEAEKQLGVWREKIEQVEGEIRYDDNLVSLSTLSVTLIEKDIKTAAYASETEQVTMALETPNVESAYDKAKEAIVAAKGRIVQSDLQQHEAGQFSGTITAALPPDSADGVIARLRQLEGRVANFQRQRAQKNQGGTGAPLDSAKLHREDVTLSLTMYNLANVEPRRSVSLLLAAASVDESYRKVLDAIASAGGRVVTASVNRGKPEQSTATMKFDIASEKADVLLAAIRAAGEVVHSETNDNPDTQNVTEAKRGFVLTIESLAAAAPRETQQLKLAASSVPDGFNDLLGAVLSKSGRIVSSQLNQQDRENVTGVLEFEVSRDAAAAIDAALKKAGDVIARNVSRSQDTQNTVDSKVQFHVDLLDALALAPRQKTTLAVEVSDVSRATRDLIAAATGAGGRSAGSTESSLDRDGNLLTRIVVEVPLAKAGSIVDQVAAMGTVRVNQTNTDEHASEGRLARAQIEVTFGNSAAVVGGQENVWDAIKHGLAVSGTGLRWSLTMIVIGFCFVAPWALIVWVLWRIFRKRRTVSPAPVQAST